MTNLETIRACTAEELAFFIVRKFDGESCPGIKRCTKACMPVTDEKCDRCWEAWLKQEADEEEWSRWDDEEPEDYD